VCGFAAIFIIERGALDPPWRGAGITLGSTSGSAGDVSDGAYKHLKRSKGAGFALES
jgi:hypothetical protein